MFFFRLLLLCRLLYICLLPWQLFFFFAGGGGGEPGDNGDSGVFNACPIDDGEEECFGAARREGELMLGALCEGCRDVSLDVGSVGGLRMM